MTSARSTDRPADDADSGEDGPPLAHVVIASTRAARGVYEDRTGPLLREWLGRRGWEVVVEVVADGDAVGDAIAAGVVGGARVVVTSGGTGIGPHDVTPEQTRPLLVRELPGIAEALRLRGALTVPTAALSRGLAGVADGPNGGVLVVNLPGSPGGVRDGITVLDELLDHAVSQLRGEDHIR